MWVSSLCDSTAKGKPDIELVDMTPRLRTIDDVMEVTTKPIILDGDTGGLTEHFVYNVRTLERMGFPPLLSKTNRAEKNSLFSAPRSNRRRRASKISVKKIRAGKNAQLTDEFMIIARIESLILEKGDAGRADPRPGLCSRRRGRHHDPFPQKEPDEIYEFCDRFRAFDPTTPIVVVPTSFNKAREAELAAHGVNIVIYANQLTRAPSPRWRTPPKKSFCITGPTKRKKKLMPFKEIISLIDVG